MPLPWVSEQRSKRPDAVAKTFHDDVDFLAEIGVRSIVAALDLPAHRKIFEDCRLHYLSLQIPDGGAPTLEETDYLLAFYNASPRLLAVHCEGGVGRTGTLLAIILLHRGLSAAAAIRNVKNVMPPALEIPGQI